MNIDISSPRVSNAIYRPPVRPTPTDPNTGVPSSDAVRWAKYNLANADQLVSRLSWQRVDDRASYAAALEKGGAFDEALGSLTTARTSLLNDGVESNDVFAGPIQDAFDGVAAVRDLGPLTNQTTVTARNLLYEALVVIRRVHQYLQ